MTSLRFLRSGTWKAWLLVARFVDFVDPRLYMRIHCRVLQMKGIRVVGTPRYIAADCWFDSTSSGLIEIQHDVVISSGVRILTHDYSPTRALIAIGVPLEFEVQRVSPVVLGRNSFIGMGAIVMPGTSIGENSIIGAGSVVRGRLEPGMIWLGNPAQPVGAVSDWAARKKVDLDAGRLIANRRAPLTPGSESCR